MPIGKGESLINMDLKGKRIESKESVFIYYLSLFESALHKIITSKKTISNGLKISDYTEKEIRKVITKLENDIYSPITQEEIKILIYGYKHNADILKFVLDNATKINYLKSVYGTTPAQILIKWEKSIQNQ